MCKKYHQKTGRTDHLRPSNSDFDPSLGLRIEVIVDFSCQCCVPFCFLRFKGRKGPKRAAIPYEIGSWTNESPKCEKGGGVHKIRFWHDFYKCTRNAAIFKIQEPLQNVFQK